MEIPTDLATCLLIQNRHENILGMFWVEDNWNCLWIWAELRELFLTQLPTVGWKIQNIFFFVLIENGFWNSRVWYSLCRDSVGKATHVVISLQCHEMGFFLGLGYSNWSVTSDPANADWVCWGQNMGMRFFKNVTDKVLVVMKVCLGMKIQFLFLQIEGKINPHFPFSGRAFIEQGTGRSCWSFENIYPFLSFASLRGDWGRT